MDVRAERTTRSRRVFREGELVQTNVVRIGANTWNRFFLGTDERTSLTRPSDECLGQSFGCAFVAARLFPGELPEAADVLLELAHHEISAVASDIFFFWRIDRLEQTAADRIGIDQRAGSEFVVLIAIAEKKFTERNDVRVIDLRLIDVARLPPIDFGLADSIGKSK